VQIGTHAVGMTETGWVGHLLGVDKILGPYGPQGGLRRSEPGFFRVMGIAKTTVLLGFTLAAYNLDRIRSFKAKHGLDDNGQVVPTSKQTRARRRSGTWD
jgi:hypothetical protein